MSHRVRIEPLKNQGPTQCHKCQRFGHMSVNCEMPSRCVRCAENHDSRDCQYAGMPHEETQQFLKCVHCGENLTSSFRGCVKRAAFVSRKVGQTESNAKKSANTPRRERSIGDTNFPPLIQADPSKRTFRQVIARAGSDALVSAPKRSRQRNPQGISGRSP